MRKFNPVLIFIPLFIIGCTKTEEDFVGSYKTLHTTKVRSGSSGFFSFYSKRPARNTTASYLELRDVEINIFKDGESLKGEAEISSSKADAFDPNTSVKKVGFDLVNFRLENDTLRFTFENQALKLMGKKVKGLIYGQQGSTIIGIDNELTTEKNYKTPNPLYISSNKEFNFYHVISTENPKSAITEKFYNLQIENYNKQLKETSDKETKQILENSIKEIEERLKLLKDGKEHE